MTHTMQLTSGNVAGVVVTLDRHFDLLRSVRVVSTGDYPATTAAAPVTYTVVSVAPTGATDVQFSGTGTLTFFAGTVLDTTYGTVVVDGLPLGSLQH